MTSVQSVIHSLGSEQPMPSVDVRVASNRARHVVYASRVSIVQRLIDRSSVGPHFFRQMEYAVLDAAWKWSS